MSDHLSYADVIFPDDIAAEQLRRLFPLKCPTGSDNTRALAQVPMIISNMNPSTLMAYTVPHSPNATNVWPDKRPDDNAPASYIAYPLPMKISTPDLQTHALVDLDWIAGRERLHLNTPPILHHTAAAASNDTARDRIPPELWDGITNYLSSDDLKALRLTCIRMNLLVTRALFKTIVVPYRQGMFSEEIRAEMKNHAGKGKAKSIAINIFKSYGRHVQKFGLSYEMSEDLLACLPKLVQHDLLESYWGTYPWPSPPIHQPDDMPESVMQEIAGMKEALSDMTGLQELALSIDNGLGWLPGPDKSIRSQIIQDRIQLFPSRGLPSRSRQAQQELWEFIKSQHVVQKNVTALAQTHLFRTERSCPLGDGSEPYTGITKELQHVDRRILTEATVVSDEPTDFCPRHGYLITARNHDWSRPYMTHPIQPDGLSQEQLDLLLKTQWAQDSLIDSYIIGIIDSKTCRHVTALNLACLPGRSIPFFDRADFWDALPCLNSLKIMVMGEVRNVRTNAFGDACSDTIMPSEAVAPLRSLLMKHIAERPNIKILTFGWVSGGEHASGLLGRNRHLLPAPLAVIRNPPSPNMMDDVGLFPHVEHLTITNSWMTPGALERLVSVHEQFKLMVLTLDSVSLQILPVAAGGQIPRPVHSVDSPIFGNPPLTFPQRAGSWSCVLDAISPNTHFGRFRVKTSNHRGKTSLKQIELLSCGYSVFGATGWGIESMDREFVLASVPTFSTNPDPIQNERRAALEPIMPRVRDMYLGRIIQHIPSVEADVLQAIWGATLGWSDPDSKHAVSLDGVEEGGTGRFSAIIRATDLD